MSINEKFREMNGIGESIGEVLKEHDINDYKVYIDSEFFRDSYKMAEDPLEIFIVLNEELEDSDADYLQEELDLISIYYYIRVIGKDRFESNYSYGATLIKESV